MRRRVPPLNESPSEKEGKFNEQALKVNTFKALNESPSEKEGKLPQNDGGGGGQLTPSMKVPPKRKGNADRIESAKSRR